MSSLTRDEAIERARLLRVTEYDIDLDLSAARQGSEFESTTRIRFECSEPGAATFAELKAVSIAEIRLNGTELPIDGVADNRISLSGLRAENELLVRATMACSTSGEGLHRFVDPEDGEVYLWAHTFLDEGQRIFACFDQPDLKAPMRLQVTSPAEWTVWSCAAGRQTEPGRWDFGTSEPLATYFMTVVAGPYRYRTAEHDGVELGLIARRSLATYLDADAEEIFDVTAACLDRYHELFGIRYPFGKYDQAFVPEFNAGAMENPGCVTFRDEFLFRSAVTEADREIRAVVIAHEMAHMWFGDLVTLRWWDDIWLNESFAEYMGVRVTAEATRFTNAWTTFSVGRKGTGYAADQRPSTHPVAPEAIADAESALLNFDGISYAKGASALRQLVAWIGDEPFLRGLRGHFDAHIHGNATLEDLLTALSRSSGRDLRSWAEVWLRTPGVSTLRPEIELDDDGRYRRVTVVQTVPDEYPILRPHRIGIGLYAGDGSGRLIRRVDVDLDPERDAGRTDIVALAGSEAPGLLLLNDGDLTFAKIRFDPGSRSRLVEVLPTLVDPLARAVAWAAAADAARDAEMAAAEFVQLVVAGLPSETQVGVFDDVLVFARGFAADRASRPEDRPAALHALAAACRKVVEEARGSRQLAATRGFIRCAGSDDAATLAGWLRGEDVPDGLAIDTDLRWAIIYRLAVLGAIGEPEIAAESERDPSAHGVEHAMRSRAAIPDPDAKARTWQLIVDGGDLSPRLVAAAGDGFWQPEHLALTEAYVDRYFAEMPAVARRLTANAIVQIARTAYPRFSVSPDTVAAAEALLAGPPLDPTLLRTVIDQTDDLRRAVRARSA